MITEWSEVVCWEEMRPMVTLLWQFFFGKVGGGGMGGSTGLSLFCLAADWRSNTSTHLFISTTSEVRTVRGPEIPSPLLSSTHTLRTPLNYAKRPFNKYGPQNTKESGYSDISPTFFFLSSLDARPRDKALNKYQVIKLHQPFVIRVFCLIPNCSWIFLMLSW